MRRFEIAYCTELFSSVVWPIVRAHLERAVARNVSHRAFDGRLGACGAPLLSCQDRVWNEVVQHSAQPRCYEVSTGLWQALCAALARFSACSRACAYLSTAGTFLALKSRYLHGTEINEGLEQGPPCLLISLKRR
jgi:hypothetical protein